MSENENQDFTLEDILKEFGDEDQEIREKSAEEILSDVEKAVLGEKDPEEAPQEEVSGDTIKFEKIADVKGTVRNAQPIDDEEEEETLPPEPEEEKAEPYSEGWEPDYDQPMGEYQPARVLSFRPQRSVRDLKKKLVEGPEKMYYTLLEKGLGKLALGIAACLLVVIISAVATAVYAFGGVPESRLKLFVFWQFLAMLIAAFVGNRQLISGVADIFRKRFSLNSLLAISFLLCCADSVFCLMEQRVPCCAAFALQVTMSLWSSYENRSTQLGQLDTMRKATRLDSLTAVEDGFEEEKLILRGEGDVDSFMDNISAPCKQEKTLSVYAVVALCLTVAAGVLSGVLHGVSVGVQVASVTALVAVPASMFVSITRPFAVLERRLHALGTVLCGWEGVEALCGKAVFPVNHSDLYPVGNVKMNGVKFFGNREPDEIFAYATALISANDGGMGILFSHVLDSRNGKHYTAEEYEIYEKGGIGGLVCGEAVLAGSIDFLKEMGVEIPEGIHVEQAVCVAIEGELCGLFAISYEKDRDCAAGITTLCNYRKLRMAVVTDDFMMTEDFVCDKFHVKARRVVFPEHAVREQLREQTPEEGAVSHALVTGEGLAAFAYAVTGARMLKASAKTGVVVHIIGGALGIAMMLVLGFLGATTLLTPAAIFLYELLFLVPGLLITEWTRNI